LDGGADLLSGRSLLIAIGHQASGDLLENLRLVHAVAPSSAETHAWRSIRINKRLSSRATAVTRPSTCSVTEGGGGSSCSGVSFTTSRAESTRRPTIRSPSCVTITRASSRLPSGGGGRPRRLRASMTGTTLPRTRTIPARKGEVPGTGVAPVKDSI